VIFAIFRFLKSQTMNTIKLTGFAFLGLALASCKKETVETTSTNVVNGDTTVVTTTTTTETNGLNIKTDSAKARWERSQRRP
jgi:hypothetical protein